MRNKNTHFSFQPRMKQSSVMCLTLTVSAASFSRVPWNCFPVQPALNSGLTLSWVGGWTLPQEGNPLRSLPTQIISQMCYQHPLCLIPARTAEGTWGRGQQAPSAGDFRGSVSSVLEKMWWPWQWQLFFTGQVCSGSQDAIPEGTEMSRILLASTVTYNNFQAGFSQAMAFQILLLQNCY